MAKVILGVGVPGSGKTSALRPFAEKYGYTYISTDDIRERISGKAIDQRFMREVWDEAYERTSAAIAKGETVVFDATFVRPEDRTHFIDFARESGAIRIEGVCAAVPYDIANERNKARDRVVPDYAMERMHGQLRANPPVIEDGFDAVFDIDEYQKLVRAELKRGDNILYKEFKGGMR